jgi:hypothetical protein
VTADPEEAVRLVAAGLPVVLTGPDAAALGGVLAESPDHDSRGRLMGVLIGDPHDRAVEAAASEMAGELWTWAARSEHGGGILAGDAQAYAEGQDPPGHGD